MNIIFVVPYVPNLIRVRPYNLIRQLSNLGHNVTVLTIWSNEREREDISELQQFCHSIEAVHIPLWQSLWNSLATVPTTLPLQASFSWQSDLAKRLGTLTDHRNGRSTYDVVHVEHLRGVRYGVYLKSINSKIPIVWDSVDCISHLFRQAASKSGRRINRWLTQFELQRTERYEAQLISQFDRVLVTSKIDRDAFANLVSSPNKSLPITILPNGVDLEYFQPDRNIRRESATLVVTGKMSYHANVSMVMYLINEIMPHIWASRPNTKIWIVGKDPRKEIEDLALHPAITVTGTVKDIRPYLQKATIALAPLTYGAGIQNKVLEAMACGTPVVTSPQAVSALNVQNGKDILIAQDPENFAKLVVELLDNPDYCSEISLSGRKFVEENHRWGSIGAQLEGIYHEVTYN
jgi:sugar transferase (PEP-CTERM/EpsH1 system associated)